MVWDTLVMVDDKFPCQSSYVGAKKMPTLITSQTPWETKPCDIVLKNKSSCSMSRIII